MTKHFLKTFPLNRLINLPLDWDTINLILWEKNNNARSFPNSCFYLKMQKFHFFNWWVRLHLNTSIIFFSSLVRWKSFRIWNVNPNKNKGFFFRWIEKNEEKWKKLFIKFCSKRQTPLLITYFIITFKRVWVYFSFVSLELSLTLATISNHFPMNVGVWFRYIE